MAFIPISTAGTAASFISHLLEQFKPSRSPYLLAVSIGALFIVLVLDNTELENAKRLLVVVPIDVIILILSVLAFYFKPFEPDDLKKKAEEINLDVDTQFKMSRTTGLMIGMACLYLIAYRRENVDELFMLLYFIALVHCLVYLIYIMFRNIKEESGRNLSYFQLSFMTSLFLFLLSYSGSKLSGDTSYFYDNCSARVEFRGVRRSDRPPEAPPQEAKSAMVETVNADKLSCEKSKVLGSLSQTYDNVEIIRIDPTLHISLSFITLVFFAVLWLFYIIFWIRLIMDVWSKSTLIISDGPPAILTEREVGGQSNPARHSHRSTNR